MEPAPEKAPLIKNLFKDCSTGLYSQQDLLRKYKAKWLGIGKGNLSRLLANPL